MHAKTTHIRYPLAKIQKGDRIWKRDNKYSPTDGHSHTAHRWTDRVRHAGRKNRRAKIKEKKIVTETHTCFAEKIGGKVDDCFVFLARRVAPETVFPVFPAASLAVSSALVPETASPRKFSSVIDIFNQNQNMRSNPVLCRGPLILHGMACFLFRVGRSRCNYHIVTICSLKKQPLPSSSNGRGDPNPVSTWISLQSNWESCHHDQAILSSIMRNHSRLRSSNLGPLFLL